MSFFGQPSTIRPTERSDEGSQAKQLNRFFLLSVVRMTIRGICHPERSEGSKEYREKTVNKLLLF